MAGKDADTAAALRENADLERKWREAKEARICKVAREHPDMAIELLCERFGMVEHEMRHVLEKHRIFRDRDKIATWYRGGYGKAKRYRYG